MKKFCVFFLIIVLLLSINTFALGQSAFKCTILSNDISNDSYRIYFIRCKGHYSNDTVNIYVTNTSKKAMKFQVTVGYGGADVQTTVESGFVEIPPEVTGRFELTELSRYPEKANTDLGYVPGSKLSESSVIQIHVQDFQEGATFVVSGFDSYESIRNTNYSAFKNQAAVQQQAFIPAYITNAKLVIKEKTEYKDDSSYEYTLSQPDNDTVKIFFDITVASAAACLGAIGVYTVCHLIKRRKNND